jgi:hypothetical protein
VLRLAQACSGSAQGCSASAQVKAAAAQVGGRNWNWEKESYVRLRGYFTGPEFSEEKILVRVGVVADPTDYQAWETVY